jgi:hypothetical protein
VRSVRSASFAPIALMRSMSMTDPVEGGGFSHGVPDPHRDAELWHERLFTRGFVLTGVVARAKVLSDACKRSETKVALVMLTFLNLLQLLLYIPLLALLGQGLLYVLAGAKRDQNFFYKLLQLLSKPFTFFVRKITPNQVADRHVPVVTLFLLLVVYVIVTLEKVSLCVQIGIEACK